MKKRLNGGAIVATTSLTSVPSGRVVQYRATSSAAITGMPDKRARSNFSTPRIGECSTADRVSWSSSAIVGARRFLSQETLANLFADHVLVLNRIAENVRRVRSELAAAQPVNEPFHATDRAMCSRPAG